MQGIKAELQDCNFTVLDNVQVTVDATQAFQNSDYNFVTTQVPKLSHTPEREWIRKNAEVYRDFGKAINDNSGRDCKTLVSGGSICTNALALQMNAPDIAALNV